MEMPKIRVRLVRKVYEEVVIESYSYIDRCNHNMNGLVNLTEAIKEDPKTFMKHALENEDNEVQENEDETYFFEVDILEEK
jgi:hypothetical protein